MSAQECRALYIHVPFCARKCPYCDFYSVPARGDLMDRYTDAVLRALERQPYAVSALDTVYFGGGTPSALGGGRIARMLEAAARHFSIAPDAEITVECNPHSALAPDLREMHAAGANRISMGMQSANAHQLRVLGRAHTLDDLTIAVAAADAAGFMHLSLDVMLATPDQTAEDIYAAAGLCAKLGAEHVSAYLLKIEEGTPFAASGIAARCPDEDGQADAYLQAVDALAALGYQQYEISNFARGGAVARHNLKYWNGEEYLGIGPSAHSFADGRRFFFPRDLEGFLAADDPFRLTVDDGAGGGAEEYVMLRARLTDGVRWDTLAKRYPAFNVEELRRRARALPPRLIVCDDGGFHLTTDGFLLSNSILSNLLA